MSNSQTDDSAKRLEAEIENHQALNEIISLSLKDMPLEEKLDCVMEIMFKVSWLKLEHKGAIFLVNPGQKTLKLAGKRFISPEIKENCAQLEFGQCLCGLAAQTGRLVCKSGVDEDHTIIIGGMTDHGHLCQPLLYNGKVIGVLNFYVTAGYVLQSGEASFLESVANTLSGVIQRHYLERERNRLIQISELSPDFISMFKENGDILFCNEGGKKLIGFANNRSSETTPGNLQQCLTKDGWQKIQNEEIPILKKQSYISSESELLRSDGTLIPIMQTIMVHRDRTGHIDSYSLTARDIRQRRAAEQAARDLALLEQRFSNRVINSLPGVFFLLDDQCCIIRWNKNLERLIGSGCSTSLMNSRLTQFTAVDQHEKINKYLKSGGGEFEIYLRVNDGTEVPFLISFTPISEFSEDYISVIGIGMDISDRKAMERELEKRASIDKLTGLFNRSRIEEYAEQFMREGLRYKTLMCVVIFDIDHFKRINDKHGHDVGDQVLATISERILAVKRDTDILGRWGGEEFVLLVPHSNLNEVLKGVERIKGTISEKAIGIAGTITASFGVTLISAADDSFTTALKRADSALYKAKEGGRNRVESI
ncbi:MAG: diguanylate cyclase [Magnetococcales bacterium]|nr:diguanylate cyclase [Magnetococcales bacterium]